MRILYASGVCEVLTRPTETYLKNERKYDMYFDSYKSILYSDTLLPDIFITEYMPSMDCNYVKVYIYCLFLSKLNKKASAEELSKKLEIPIDKVKEALTYLESIGIIIRNDNGITMVDLKEKEINKIYRAKSTSTPEEAVLSSERSKKRSKTISAINCTFFQGVMPPSWYTDIDAWFDRYKFEEDVMYALFQHCYNHNGLSKNYMLKVADNWHSKGIRNSFDLDKYFIEYQKLKDIRLRIIKKLKRRSPLTEFEEALIEKWIVDYKYNFEIIEYALKKTTGTSEPNFNYIDTVITDWYKRGLKSKEEIVAYDKTRKSCTGKRGAESQPIPQHANFKQRKYDKGHYDNLYEDV
jgi:DnaD/phage-associated family protein